MDRRRFHFRQVVSKVARKWLLHANSPSVSLEVPGKRTFRGRFHLWGTEEYGYKNSICGSPHFQWSVAQPSRMNLSVLRKRRRQCARLWWNSLPPKDALRALLRMRSCRDWQQATQPVPGAETDYSERARHVLESRRMEGPPLLRPVHGSATSLRRQIWTTIGLYASIRGGRNRRTEAYGCRPGTCGF